MSKTLTIRYTSDTHGYLYPTSYADMQDRPMGLMKLASEYPHDGNTLIIDGGDTIQGSPLTNLYQRLSPEEKAAAQKAKESAATAFKTYFLLSALNTAAITTVSSKHSADEIRYRSSIARAALKQLGITPKDM